MKTEQTIRWLLPTLVSMVLVFAACTGIADTRAATISTPALIFESPTPSTALEEGAAGATPDLVVVVVTPTSDGKGEAANQETAGNTNVDSGESGNDTAAATPASSGTAATPASVEMSADELLSTGEQVFSTNCASCHQLNGEGTSEYPALTNNDFVTGDDPTAVLSTILHGRGEMPAFEDNLSTQQIAAVASYIRNTWANSAPVVMVAQVRQVKQGGSAQTTPASTPGETPAASTSSATDTAGLSTANAMTGTATVTATTTMIATEPVTATAQTTATTAATPSAAATPGMAMTTTPTATARLSSPNALPTAAGVTWTPAPVVTATLGTTPIPTGTPVPEEDATTSAAATPSPATAASSATTPAADSSDAAATVQPAVTATPISDDQLVSMGQDVYARNCASCHQLNGEGTSSYPALNNNAFVTDEDPTGPITTVRHGRGEMPAFEDTLSNQEIAAVLSFVRNNWDNSAAVVHVAQVRQVAQSGDAAAGEGSTEGAQDGQTASQTPTGAETPAAATATMTSTVATSDASAAGERGSNPQETSEAGVPKQAEATVEPPETDSMTALDEAAEEATPVSPEALITLGETLYTMNCAACHQAEGQGIAGIYPMLAGNAFVTTADPAAVVEVVITGRAGMPRFSDDLSARQIAAILSYVRTSWDNDAAAVNPEQVRTVRETIGGSGAAGGH